MGFVYCICSSKHPEILPCVSHRDVSLAEGTGGKKVPAAGRGRGGRISVKPSVCLCGVEGRAVGKGREGLFPPLSCPNSVEKGLRKTGSSGGGRSPPLGCLILTQSWDLPETGRGVPPPSAQPPLHSWNFWVVCGCDSALPLASLTFRVLPCASEEERSLGHPGLGG